MKKIIFTQRVELVESYNERRDCADQNIARFILACGYIPIPIPNISELVLKIVNEIVPDGIILTGGNSLVKYGGDAPERDETDKKLLDIALKKKIPVYGFCRGMQSILDYFGCELKNVKNHVAVNHSVYAGQNELIVNSYHNQAADRVTDSLEVLYRSEDTMIEAVKAVDYPIIATMWHPERMNPFQQNDIHRIKKLFH